jgi:4-amino-4-deoxy-L-arabinose transferase-like glycosyltransferase
MIPFFGLMPQDAYYHFYGKHLALSYFDHPGMIGYILRLFTSIFGKHVWAIKFADFVITSFTLIAFYHLATLVLPKKKAQNALLLMGSTILISILSLVSTPDVPLLLFWTLSILFLYKAIFENKIRYWILAGIAIGLALNSKYTALFLFIGLMGFLLFSNKYRKLWASPGVWICLFISLLVFSPVLWWNVQNDFVSLTFQSSQRTKEISEFNISFKNFAGVILHQSFILLPILFFTIATITYKYLKKIIYRFKLPSQKTLFLLSFFIPVFLGFFLISPFYWVKLNWMMPAYITGIILVTIFVSLKMRNYQIGFSVFFHLLLFVQVLFYAVPIKSNDTWYGWDELASEVQIMQKKYPNTFVFSFDGYKTSAVLDFYLDENVYAQNIVGLPALQFDYADQNLSVLNQKNALFIDSDTSFKNRNKRGKIQEELNAYFEEITELEPIIIKKGEREVRKFWVYYCKNYKGR